MHTVLELTARRPVSVCIIQPTRCEKWVEVVYDIKLKSDYELPVLSAL